MSLAVLSVGALALAIIVSCVTTLNVGVLAVALAWIIGVYVGGIPVATVMGGFPTQLFLTLTGMTLLFTAAQCNGTLDRLAHHAVRLCRGNRGVIPIMFFLLGGRPGVDGARQHRDGRDRRADGHGNRRSHRHPAVPDGDHGRQRCELWLAVAVRADRHHRQRPDGAQRPGRLRTVDLSLQPRCARAGGLRRAISCSAG